MSSKLNSAVPECQTVTVPAAAAILGISRNVAYQHAAEGKLPVIKLGGRVLVVRAGLQRMLDAAEVAA